MKKPVLNLTSNDQTNLLLTNLSYVPVYERHDKTVERLFKVDVGCMRSGHFTIYNNEL